MFVEAFDEIIQGSVAQYVSLSQKIGGDVQKHVRHSSHDNHASILLLKSFNMVKPGKVLNLCESVVSLRFLCFQVD